MNLPGPTGPTLALTGVGVPAFYQWTDSGSHWVLLACWVALCLVAFAAAAETALYQTGVFRLRKLLQSARANGSRSEPALWDEANHNRLLVTVQILHIVMLLNLGGLLVSLLVTRAHLAWHLALGLGGGLATVLVTEFLARGYAYRHSQWMARLILPTGLTLMRVASPMFWLLGRVTKPFAAAPLDTAALADDLEELTEEIQLLQRKGLLEQDQGQILQSAFQFGETIAREVMVPRVDMVCVELGSSLHQVLDLMIQCGYTRLPVYEESVDNILGLVHAKDLLRKWDSTIGSQVKSQPLAKGDLREILVVPGSKKIAKTLRDLQRTQATMAIVVDEYGGTDGLLTLEDIVEEIVGEITDEYDQAHEGIQLLKDGSSIVDAKIIIEDVNEFLRLDLPHDDHETLGGYVYGLFGRVPHAGEQVVEGELQFTVESVHKQRIKRVHIRPAPTPVEPSENDGVSDETVVTATS